MSGFEEEEALNCNQQGGTTQEKSSFSASAPSREVQGGVSGTLSPQHGANTWSQLSHRLGFHFKSEIEASGSSSQKFLSTN